MINLCTSTDNEIVLGAWDELTDTQEYILGVDDPIVLTLPNVSDEVSNSLTLQKFCGDYTM